MSKILDIRGQVFFKDLGMGAWGIKAMDGTEYRPIEMPEQLKHKGDQILCRAISVEEEFSIHMWGEPIKIISFSTSIGQ